MEKLRLCKAHLSTLGHIVSMRHSWPPNLDLNHFLTLPLQEVIPEHNEGGPSSAGEGAEEFQIQAWVLEENTNLPGQARHRHPRLQKQPLQRPGDFRLLARGEGQQGQKTGFRSWSGASPGSCDRPRRPAAIPREQYEQRRACPGSHSQRAGLEGQSWHQGTGEQAMAIVLVRNQWLQSTRVQ